LLQCLEDLDNSLRKLNSRLFVVRGQPADVLPTLFKEWGTTYFTFEEDPEPYGRVRDQNIIAMCKEMGIVVTKEHSHTLYNLQRIIDKNNGKAPLTYKRFQTIIEGMDPPPTPVPTLTLQMLGNGITPLTENHDEKYGVPTLEELGFDCENLKSNEWVGGETEALSRLERHLERKAWVASFGRPKMTPQSLLACKTGLSPYLRFGCLSTRLFYHALTDLYRKIKKCDPPLSLHGQLLWREFFYCASTNNPNFDKMEGNPICVQIPWDKNDEALNKWANANTGFPWIDAIMTQLREEGWIHHLARHAVACFLTRGDLWVSWEEGMKVFEELLLDADLSVNAGTWLWLSCSSFFQQFFHCYCPVKFGRKADASGDFIRRYLPVLKNYPTRYIHEPWTAPEDVQKSAKCIIGQDYPKPICNHGYVSKMNMERMKQVYQQLAQSSQSGQAGSQVPRGVPQDLLNQLPKSMGPKSSSPLMPTTMGPPQPPQIKKKGTSLDGNENDNLILSAQQPLSSTYYSPDPHYVQAPANDSTQGHVAQKAPQNELYDMFNAVAPHEAENTGPSGQDMFSAFMQQDPNSLMHSATTSHSKFQAQQVFGVDSLLSGVLVPMVPTRGNENVMSYGSVSRTRSAHAGGDAAHDDVHTTTTGLEDLIMSPNLSVANISMSPSNMSMSSTGIVVSPARTFGMSSLDQMTALDCDGIQTNQSLYRNSSYDAPVPEEYFQPPNNN